ncbi:lasso peptide biosynthesis B2 protein (plasmid) [Tistrella mobilis]|jgi:hypothetical protein|uniref:lasso peptide biosynthesis B2 protein n=1 Tax=Tistrella mobilis TaxID=171437 RepID=UPI0035565F8F
MTTEPAAASSAPAATPPRPRGDIWIQRLLVIEAAFCLALAVTSVKLIPFRRLAAWSSRRPEGARLMPPDTTDLNVLRADPDWRQSWRIGRLVAVAARKVPFKAVCLPQALAGQSMLRRRGVPVEIVYGVKRDTETGGIAAHAWLEYRGCGFLGQEVAPDHTEIARFPADRARRPG